MEDLHNRITQLKNSLRINDKQSRIRELESALQAAGVWDNAEAAGAMAQELAALQKVVEQWQHVSDMIAAGTEADRPDLEGELHQLEQLTYLGGPHDTAPAIISIHAGTGGVDAMDWAEILLKMYMRYAEKQGWSVTTLDYSRAEEAGIKSATVRIAGENAYGYLRGEGGVHRLVRLSPFNAKNLRQTSFALVEVTPEIAKTELEVPEKDLRIDVYRASGHGGQGVNTTDSAVRITHLPTGLVVTCQNERSQLQNRATAMRILTSRLVTIMEQEHASELSQLKPQVQGSWGNQIRSYVMQPYTMVKDHRTNHETSDVQGVLSGDLDAFMQAELERLATGGGLASAGPDEPDED